jgi:hypothetical protein
MASILDESAPLICSHGGQVQATPSIRRVTVGGLAPLAQDDSFVILGCPFTLGSSPHPCTAVQWLTATQRVTAQGKPLVIESSTGLCKAADGAPQGSPTVIVTQRRVSAR